MKKFYQTIKERKLQIFFLMYILLLVPSMSLIAQNIPAKTVDVVVGTHALIQNKVEFHRLGFVIINEQHRD